MTNRVVEPTGDNQSPLVLCAIEGCSRASIDGQDDTCGLAKVYGLGRAPHVPECGAVATIDLWIDRGLLPGLFDEEATP